VPVSHSEEKKMKTNATDKYRSLFTILLVMVFIFTIIGNSWSSVSAQDIPAETPTSQSNTTEPPYIEVVTPNFSIEHITLADGTLVSGYIINGPSKPSPEYKAERIASIKPITTDGVLPNFPSYSWVFGCSAVSGAMVAAYYDRGSYPNIYTGPTNGGVMPLTDTYWPVWSDGFVTYPNNPLIASHNGVDGRSTRGSIDDYWVKYNSTADDPYITNGWLQHAWGTAIGDFMKTSQSAYGNVDGSTSFYNWTSNPGKLTCSDMETNFLDDLDGTYGRKLFYEARGYSVSDCYNQKTDNNAGGFTLANFQAEIDAGNPVLLNLYGHSIVGYGYDGSTIYIRDTWDNDPSHTYTMSWGGSYDGRELLSVSVVHVISPQLTKRSYMPLVMNPIVNRNPTNILLSNSTIEENQPINTVIGTLSTTDPDAGDTFTYSLVSGAGDTGNSSFNISGNKLRSSVVFDYESQNSYSVRIRTTDQGNLFFEKVFTITITPVNENPILNGDFEQGHVAWTEYSTHGWEVITQDFPGEVTPYNGTWAVWAGGDYDDISYIEQQVLVPTTAPYLSYWHWIASEDFCGYDFGGVIINGTVVESYDLCENNNTGGWVQRVVDLSAYAGQSVSLQIRAECDFSLNSNLFIDHVAFQSTPGDENPAPESFIVTGASLPKSEVLGK
jgi:hypothetical protein